jgi:hypothetical protein
MDTSAVTKSMLEAAKNAAGNSWDKIQHNFARDVNSVIENSAEIEAALASKQIIEADADDLLRSQSLTMFVLSREIEVDGKVIAQNAINAAIDVLVAAVKTAAKFP